MVASKSKKSFNQNNSDLIKLRKLFSTIKFAKYYLGFSLLILLFTTLFWSIKSSFINLSNADQLVDPYFFQNSSSLTNAQFPGTHTFFLKWPLFYLIKLFNFNSVSYEVTTILLVLATISGFAYIIYRIERRPLVLGTIFLALASCLLLIPTQPYPGSLLPVNMAMITTRNIEYILYILSLMLFIRVVKIKSRSFWLAVLFLTVLISGDKFFLAISLGGSLLTLLFYALSKKWKLVSLSAVWLLGTITATTLSIGLLWLFQVFKFTKIANQTSAGPYGYVHNLHDIAQGVIYSITGLFTNLGANPAHNTAVLGNIPHEFISNIFSVGGPSYIVNIFILMSGIFCAYWFLKYSFTHTKSFTNKNHSYYHLVILLAFSVAASFIVFIFSRHEYSVDARYLSLALFTVFIAITLYVQSKKWKPEQLLIVGSVLSITILCGVFAANINFNKQTKALADINNRNIAVQQVINHRGGYVLVGNYWRVVPIKYKVGSKLRIMPLGNCTQPRVSQSSGAWHYNLNKIGFDYLLTLDKGLTNYPKCSFSQIIKAYGHPNSSTLIAGSLSQPKELLLRYDNGINISGPLKKSKIYIPDTISPISLSDLPNSICTRPTIMTVVAHQDDDLLFINPDTIYAAQNGNCLRTIYVTAGDSGLNDNFYWLNREQGAEAAYSLMTGSSNTWEERIIKISNNEYITLANPRGNTNISLIFLRLPDGNLAGNGFKVTNNESLAKLYSGSINIMHSVDKQSFYSKTDLVNLMNILMHFYQPSEIHTLANYNSKINPDHSDHMSVGAFVKLAYAKYEKEQYNNQVIIPIKFYIGYPIRGFAPNVSSVDAQNVAAVFLTYAKLDGLICKNHIYCNNEHNYEIYFNKQYTNPY